MNTTIFVIEDELHAEVQPGEFTSFSDAFEELKRFSKIPWNEPPNLAPCNSWKTCGRNYEIIEYDASSDPSKEVNRIPILQIDSSGIIWLYPKILNTAEQGAAANP